MSNTTDLYVVIQWLTPTSYDVLNIPFTYESGKQEKPLKFRATCMERLPYMIYVHKRL